ncbi:MAG: DUF6351 family protein, partial [Limnobacter sp.]|nr:DUF6351 family protein [Limnobacter sp.]
MKHLFATSALALACSVLVACGSDGMSTSGAAPIDRSGANPPVMPPVEPPVETPVTPPPEMADGQIRVLSNRSDLISGGNALVEVVLADASLLDGAEVSLNGEDITSVFSMTEDSRYIGLVEGMRLGSNTLRVSKIQGKFLSTDIVNHPLGGPVFSGPQVQPWTCTNAQAMDAQCNQPPTFELKYLPADKLQNILMNSDPEGRSLADALQPFDPENPPADEDIAQTTTDNGTTLPFIVRIERGFQNRDRYQVMSLFQPDLPWTAKSPQPQWNRKLLIHHGGNVGVTYGPGNPPNGDISGTAPDGAEFATGDSILVGVGRGFVALSTALANLGHNVNLVTSAESLVMAKEHIIENYGELKYTIGTGCSGGAIAQQHVANAYPGIYQGIIVQCSYPDVWTTATQFADYRLLNLYFGNEAPVDEASSFGDTSGPESREDVENFVNLSVEFFEASAEFVEGLQPSTQQGFAPFASWSFLYGHLPVNPAVSDFAFFPSVFPNQGEGNCPGLRGAAMQYDADTNAGGLRCGLIDYMKTQFGTRTPDVWTPNERQVGRGFGGIPLDNTGVQYGLKALLNGQITESQFIDLNTKIGGFNVDIEPIPERFVAD